MINLSLPFQSNFLTIFHSYSSLSFFLKLSFLSFSLSSSLTNSLSLSFFLSCCHCGHTKQKRVELKIIKEDKFLQRDDEFSNSCRINFHLMELRLRMTADCAVLQLIKIFMTSAMHKNVLTFGKVYRRSEASET